MFGFEKILDFDKLDLANLVVELQISCYLQKILPKGQTPWLGFEKIMDFSMDIDKLNLAKLMAKPMDEILGSAVK